MKDEDACVREIYIKVSKQYTSFDTRGVRNMLSATFYLCRGSVCTAECRCVSLFVCVLKRAVPGTPPRTHTPRRDGQHSVSLINRGIGCSVMGRGFCRMYVNVFDVMVRQKTKNDLNKRFFIVSNRGRHV